MSSSGRTPLPMRQVIPLLFLQFSEASGITIVMPLMPRIILNFYGMSEDTIGVAVGAIDASFMCGKFFSSFTVGAISDVIGRRKPILFGLIVTIVGFSLLTLVRNYFLALFLVFCISFLNGNLGLVKAALADITDSSNRGVAFSYLGAVFATARATAGAIGSFSFALGGFLVPSFPYAVPMLVCVSLNVLSFISAAIFVPRDKKKPEETVVLPPASGSDVESGMSDNETPKPKKRGGVIGALMKFRFGLKTVAKDPVLTRLFVLNCLGATGNGALLTVMLLFCSTDVDVRGLGIPSTDIGYIFLLFGGFGCVFQLSSFSRLNKRFTLRAIYRVGCAALATSSLFFPAVLFFRTTAWMQWTALAVVMFPGAIGFMMLMPVGSTMVANSADAKIMGLTQGVGQSMQSLLRATGPLTAGSLFSLLAVYKMPFLTFYFVMIVHVSCLLISLPLPMRVEGEHYVKQEEEKARLAKEGAGDVEMRGTASLLSRADPGKYDDDDGVDGSDEDHDDEDMNGNRLSTSPQKTK